MTINKVIANLKSKKSHTYSDEDVAGWISDLDGEISLNVQDADVLTSYTFPDDADVELLVGKPFEDIYFFYCAAQIDFLSQEYEHQANASVMFNGIYKNYSRQYIRTHLPAESGPILL